MAIPVPEDALTAVCDQLHALQCPLLAEAGTPWLREVLLQPSDHRTSLLHWCCLQIEPTLAERLPEPSDKRAVREALAGLGFCRRDSGLLTEPLTPAAGALFWRPLLSIAALLRRERQHPVHVAPLGDDLPLLTELCRSEQLQDALRSPPDLIAADLRPDLDTEPPPEPAELSSAAATAGRQLADLDARLHRLQAGRPRADDRQLAALRQLCERTCCLLAETRRQLAGVRPRLDAAPRPPAPLTRLASVLTQAGEAFVQAEQTMEDARAVAAAKPAPTDRLPSGGAAGDTSSRALVADLGRRTAQLTL